MTDKFIRKYYRMARFVAQDQNPCLSRAIGSVIVDATNPRYRVVSMGYNGPIRGTPHQDSYEFLKEYVYPQLSEQDKQNTKKFKELFNIDDKMLNDPDLFAKEFEGCKICPRQLIGAISGERLALCACLSFESRIQLDTGEWVKIGKLVQDKYDGYVKSLNTATNQIENKKVCGWYEIDKDSPYLYKIFSKYGRRSKYGRLGAKFTSDHQLLTQDGWKRVDQIASNYDKLVLPEQALNTNQLQLVLGSLLGDASITRTAGSARFIVSHAGKFSDYVDFKIKLLGNLFSNKEESYRTKVTPSKKIYENHHMIRLSSISKIEFAQIRNMVYCNGFKQVVSSWLDQINWLGLCFWFLDDGSRVTDKTGYIACHKFFKTNDEKILQNWLSEKFNLSTYIDRKQKRLIFNTDSFRKLCDNIYQYVPSCMRYKLTPEYRRDYENTLPEHTDRIVYDDVERIEQFDIKRADCRTKVYCIDVEDNHNFLTLNAVAHNCAHSERNALANAAEDVYGFYMFCWCGVPCLDCATQIIQHGISKVYCLQDEQRQAQPNAYNFQNSRWFFNKAKVELIEKTPGWVMSEQ